MGGRTSRRTPATEAHGREEGAIQIAERSVRMAVKVPRIGGKQGDSASVASQPRGTIWRRFISSLRERGPRQTLHRAARSLARRAGETRWGELVAVLHFHSIAVPLFRMWKWRHRREEVRLPCLSPFVDLEITTNGSCHLCCPSWLPVSVGDVRGRGVRGVFNSIRSQKIRMAMYRGTYAYCNHDLCPHLNPPGKRPMDRQSMAGIDYLTPAVREEILARKLVLTGPVRLTEVINETCNIKCDFCSLPSSRHNRDLFSIMAEYIEENARQVRLVSFCGGEPFTNPDVKELLRRHKGSEIRFNFTTNLNYLGNEQKQMLEQLKLGVFHISLNAARKETYEMVCHGGKWDKVLDHIQFVTDMRSRSPERFTIQASMVVTKETHAEVLEFLKFGLARDIDRLILYPLLVEPQNAHLEMTASEALAVQRQLEDPILRSHADRLVVAPLQTDLAKIIRRVGPLPPSS